MPETVFFTGFPGFLGSELLPRVLARDPATRAVCLVQPRFAALARDRAEEVGARSPAFRGRIRIVEGDIGDPGLGLAPGVAVELAREVVEVYHLAAVYDLAVRRELAMRVNVDGTRNLITFARSCGALRRFHHVSTCFVSGRHPGVFAEDDLEVGQSFNNVYEETKYLAEIEVRDSGLPATIYRPAVVVGDSGTGATQKYDGPYYVIQWLLRQPRVAMMPVAGDPTATVFNVVPRDFVVNSIAYLSGRPESLGRVFHLAETEPLTVDAMLRVIGRATGRSVVRIPLTRGVARWALERVPGMYAWMRIPPEAIDYFVHPTRYATDATRAALQGSGIVCPGFAEYAPRLVDFARAHPEVGAAAMA
jgi:thioester reductase-like protein